jgi:hypothetical protein
VSLDVYLEEPKPASPIREHATVLLALIDAGRHDEQMDGLEQALRNYLAPARVYDANITHNLGEMAGAAGIYQHLWRPEEVGITTAAQLIEPLRAGLSVLESGPERFRQYNPSNGWGSYDGLVRFVREYLEACEENPEATVRAWR